MRVRHAATFALAAMAMAGFASPQSAWAQDDAALPDDAAPASEGPSLAEQLANPVASLISVPFQANYDCCYGPDDGDRFTLNIQPVIPVTVGDDWNLITRTILPVISAGETIDGAGGATGLGDVVQSFFLSPKEAKNGLVWGVGPVFLYPTGKSDFSADKLGAGPTFVVLKQGDGITLGLLANHIWSIAGKNAASDVSATFIQPFITRTLPDSTSFTLNLESTRDWERKTWTVPVNFTVSHVVNIGKQPVSLAAGGRYYAERPSGGPRWGTRFVVTLLFPK